MPCRNVTIQAPEPDLQSGTVTITGETTGTNQGSLDFQVENPNNRGASITVEGTVDGTTALSQTYSIPANSTVEDSLTATFDFNSGSGQHSVNMCIDVVNTEEQ